MSNPPRHPTLTLNIILRVGVPSALRARVWHKMALLQLSSSPTPERIEACMEDGLWESAPTSPVGSSYQELLAKPLNAGEFCVVESIEKDLGRTFPDSVQFGTKHLEALHPICNAYS